MELNVVGLNRILTNNFYFKSGNFACEVMAAMLVGKNNSLSLHRELIFIFMQIMRKATCIVLTSNMAALSCG